MFEFSNSMEGKEISKGIISPPRLECVSESDTAAAAMTHFIANEVTWPFWEKKKLKRWGK